MIIKPMIQTNIKNSSILLLIGRKSSYIRSPLYQVNREKKYLASKSPITREIENIITAEINWKNTALVNFEPDDLYFLLFNGISYPPNRFYKLRFS